MPYAEHVESYRIYMESRSQAAAVRHEAARAKTGDSLLNEHDVALRQARSVRTLQNQRVQGGGIPYLKLGRAVRYRLSDVIAWEDARRFSNTSEEGQRDT
ncbi:helix-turn-helix transcriptional regulator [Methylobacterium thuringiense]|uniref:DNA-binding protein n=1 Tax=Methylobacterium thuringiense TaxID=1003091 RepID=A0ABQ4TFU7_9HYPH|nr:helix-turn-helix domain-containing protein [Methylobacterium thuringiense]GJE53796.1 hypothetical protein EKPJFOCH_0264 [Methylobacterium thuringiense]